MDIQVKDRFFIGGSWVDAETDERITVLNPATGQPLAQVARADRAATARAIRCARQAFEDGPWRFFTPRERSRYLIRMAEAIERRKEEVLDLLVAEAGSPRAMVEPMQYGFGMHHFRDMAERVVAGHEPIAGIPPVLGRGVGQGVVMTEPVGVAALITAFNFPFHINLMKIGPALGAGCTAVLKPSELTPLTGLILGEIAEEVELPPGVLNIIAGDAEAGEELSTHDEVDIVSFTGSVAVGRRIMQQAAVGIKKVVLELGGKSAGVVFADADLDAAARSVVFHMTLHSGQACALQTRTLVEDSVHDELADRVVSILDNMPVGDSADENTLVGPVISARQRDRIEGYIEQGKQEGGQLARGGTPLRTVDGGFFVEPTLFADCDNSMTIAQEEIFGPVGTMIRFQDREAALSLANDTRYGLAAGVWSGDAQKAYAFAQRLRAGLIEVNGGVGGVDTWSPYGGYKHSGLGREYGQRGFEEFLESKAIGWPAIAGW